jgi:hypothetical protein
VGPADHSFLNRWSNGQLQRQHKENKKIKAYKKSKQKQIPNNKEQDNKIFFNKTFRVSREIILLLTKSTHVYLCGLEQRVFFGGMGASNCRSC